METQIIKVPFRSDVIETVKTEKGDIRILAKKVCDLLSLDWSGQLKKLRTSAWGGVEIISIPDSTGKTQEQVTIPMRALPMWLASLNPDKVKPELREKVIVWQLEAADALYVYFMKGVAINPRVAEETVRRELDDHYAEVRMKELESESIERAMRTLEKGVTEIELLVEHGILTKQTGLAHRAQLLKKFTGIDLMTAPQVAFQNVTNLVPDIASALAAGAKAVTVMPVKDLVGFYNAKEIAAAIGNGIQAVDVGVVADDLDIRPSILRGELTWGDTVPTNYNGHVGAQARYNEAAKLKLIDCIKANIAVVKERSKHVRAERASKDN
jgi:hypothetical protein